MSQMQPQDERLRQAAVGAKAATPRVGREKFAAEAKRQKQNTAPRRTSSNPLSALIMNSSTQGAVFPDRAGARAPSSQGTAKQPPSNTFPKREQVVSPSSQGTAKHPPSNAFPKREQVRNPSSQGTAKIPPSNAFPNREQIAPPSSQGVAKNPPTNAFPKREQAAQPSSQGVAKQPPANAFPKREKVAPPSSQSPLTTIANSANSFSKRVETKSRPKAKGFGKPAMKTLPSQEPPLTTQLKEGMTAEEAEQTRAARLSGTAESVSENAKKATPTQISAGMTAEEAEAARTTRLSDEAEAIKKAWTSESSEPKSIEAGKDSEEPANTPPKAAQVYVGTKPQFVRTNPPKEASPQKVANALKDLAMGSSAKKLHSSRPLLDRGGTSLSNLAASNQGVAKKPMQKVAPAVERKPLAALLSKEKPIGSGRKSSSKLGGIASPEEKPIKEERQQAMKVQVIAAATASSTEKNASAEPSKPRATSISLTDIIVGQEKPALAQQNVGKRNSLFPAKKESRLSRLLKK